MKFKQFGPVWGILLLISVGCSDSLPVAVQQEMDQLPDKIDYNFHVKPILSDRCFACHGPDAQKREADLRLDLEEDAYAALTSGSGRAIKPGSLSKSLLAHRILSEDPEEIMPPFESNLSLTEAEKAILLKWIKQGAEYKDHWAFSKPAAQSVSVEKSKWANNEIDVFVEKKLLEKGISPAPEAQREQLIRRVYFDITGLPPSLSELDKWLSMESATYYQNMVDSLLESPAYGERMAAHWLDVARFADSEGYLDDFHHTFWPYRDWVIKAFNGNLSYDKFILWQVGGDQIPGATTEQKLATAFNRNHKQNSEGGVIPEEFRVEYVADRTNTIGTAFLGLTVGCARCHDHKYDPFTQKNYYELFSFFNSTIERGDGIFSNNSIEFGQRVPNELSMNAGPVLALSDQKVAEIRKGLLEEIDLRQEAIKKAEKENNSAFESWRNGQKDSRFFRDIVEQATVSHLSFDKVEGGKSTDKVKGNKAPTYWGGIEASPGKIGGGLRSDAQGQFVADGTKSSFERMEPFTISFWINTPKHFDRAHVMYNGNNRIQGYRGWDVILDSNRVNFRLSHAHPYQSLDIADTTALGLNEWVHYVWTYDGSSKAEGMRLFKNGEEIIPKIQRNYLYRSTEPYTDLTGTVYMAYKGIVIGNRHYDQDFTGGLLDEIRILNKEADPLVASYLYDQETGEQKYREAVSGQPEKAEAFYDLLVDASIESLREQMRAIQAREIRTIDTVQEIMVMGDWEMERPTYVLDRGVYDAHGEPVERNIPNKLLPWPEAYEKNRYGLGQWLIDPDHPLTARVAVNQFWYLMFGRGIVKTVEDFGNQGALPSHPKLLDWLAVDFMENGWNVKRLIRQMLLSSTYRQSSKIRPELKETDPNNYLLARGPRYRRSAEMVRDNALAVSGLLNPTIGGPSAFPYQPPNLWKEVMTHTFFPEYQEDVDDGLYRRSLYTFWKRNMPPPSMLIFDASYRAECQPRRQRSSTPLQALVLLNDPQILEACRVLAENLWEYTQGDVEEATRQSFRLLTSRLPNSREQKLLLAQYQEELQYFQEDPKRSIAYLDIGYRPNKVGLMTPEVAALSRVNNTLINSTEAYYKN